MQRSNTGNLCTKANPLSKGDYLFISLVRALVSKCSATLASVAAPPAGARRGCGGPSPNCPRHPSQVGVLHPSPPQEPRQVLQGGAVGCNRALWAKRGTPLRHTQNCRKSDRWGVASAPLSLLVNMYDQNQPSTIYVYDFLSETSKRHLKRQQP